MPFFSRLRRTTSRYGGRKRPYTTPYTRVKRNILKGAKRIIKTYVNTERKYFDTSQTGITVPITPLNYPLVSIPSGTGESQRIGNQVKLTNVNMRLQIARNGADTDAVRKVRILVFLDKQNNGVASDVADLLDSTTMTSFNDMDNKMRYKVLMDRIITLDLNSPTSGMQINKYFKLTRKLVYSFSGDPPIQNNITLALFSDTSDVNKVPVITFNTRSRYIDN